MGKFYLIVYNRPANFNAQVLNNFINKANEIEDWWHFLESAYIIKTSLSALKLQEKFQAHFNGILFLIISVNTKDNGGYLPKQAWDWLNSRT